MLTNVFQHNFTHWCYVKQHVKTPPELTSGKASFSGKSKMAVIMPVIYVFF